MIVVKATDDSDSDIQPIMLLVELLFIKFFVRADPDINIMKGSTIPY